MEFPRFNDEERVAVVKWFQSIENELEGGKKCESLVMERVMALAKEFRTPTDTTLSILENLTLDMFLSVVGLLIENPIEVRQTAVLLLINLGRAMSPKKAGNIDPTECYTKATEGMREGWEVYAAIKHLFLTIGSYLETLAPIAVSSLESLFMHPDTEKQKLGIVVCTALASANSHLFNVDEVSRILWDIYLQIEKGDSTGHITQDERLFSTFDAQTMSQKRSIIVEASLDLITTIPENDPQFADQLVQTILHIRPRTSHENAVLRKSMVLLIERLIRIGLEKDLHGHLISLLTSNQQDLYPNLHFAVEQCIRASPQNANSKRLVIQFLTSLERYLLAPLSTLRYGALVCMHATLTSFPLEFLNVLESSIFAALLSECLDPNQQCLRLALTCIKIILSKQKGKRQTTIGTGDSEEISPSRQCLNAIKQYESLVQSQTQLAGSDRPSALLRSIVHLALPLCTYVPETALLRISSGLQFLPRSEKIQRMEILSLWSQKMTKVTPLVINNLLIAIRESDATMGILAVDVFQKIAPFLSKVLRDRDPSQNLKENAHYRSICAIETGFRQVLERNEDEICMKTVQAVGMMPFEYFEENRLESICRLFFSHAATASKFVRLAIYKFFGNSKRLWRTKGLRSLVAGCLLSLFGDPSNECLEALIASTTTLLEGAGMQDTANAIKKISPNLVGQSSRSKANGFAALLMAIMGGKENASLMEKIANHENVAIVLPEWFSSQASEIESSDSSQKITPDEKYCVHQPYFLCLAQIKCFPDCREPLDVLFKEMACHNKERRQLACATLMRALLKDESSAMIPEIARQYLDLGLVTFQDSSTKSHLLESIFRVAGDLVYIGNSTLNMFLLDHFTLPALTQLEREDSHSCLKLCALEYIIALMLTSPEKMIGHHFLSLSRNAIRESFAFRDPALLAAAQIAYPLVINLASITELEAEDCFLFLVTDLAPIQEDAIVAEPVVSNLDPSQLRAVIQTSIRCLGELQHPSTIAKAIDVLLDFIHHKDNYFRLESVKSLLLLSSKLSEEESGAVRWLSLPLIADPYPPIRNLFSLFSENKPLDKLHHLIRTSSISKAVAGTQVISSDDGAVDELAKGMDLLYAVPSTETVHREKIFKETSWAVQVDVITDAILPRTSFEETSVSKFVKKQSTNSRVEVSAEMITQMTTLAGRLCGRLRFTYLELIEYHLHFYTHMLSVNGSGALLLAEIARCLSAGAVQLDEDTSTESEDSQSIDEKIIGIIRALYMNVNEADEFAQSINLSSAKKAKPATKNGRRNSSSSVSRGLLDSNLITGSSIGLQHIGKQDPARIFQFVLPNMCMNETLHLSHLLLLKLLFQIFPDDPSKAKDFIDEETIGKLRVLILNCISSKTNPTKTKKAALDLIGELTSLSGTEELSDVIQCMLSTLEENTDATIHAASQAQLSRVFSTLSIDHPFVKSLIEYVEAGLTSCESRKRQRSFTLLSIVANAMGASEATPGLIRALSDPDSRIRQMALKSLLTTPPEFLGTNERFIHGIRAIINEMELEKSIQRKGNKETKSVGRRRRRKSATIMISQEEEQQSTGQSIQEGSGSSSNSRGGTNGSLPLSDDDPLNLEFLQSDETYRNLLQFYGLEPLGFVKGQMNQLETDSSSLLRSQAWLVSTVGLSERSMTTIQNENTNSVVSLLLNIHPPVAINLQERLETDVANAIEMLKDTREGLIQAKQQDRRGSFNLISDSKAFAMGDQVGLGSLQMEQIIHNFTVYASILRSPEVLPGSLSNILAAFQVLCEECAGSAEILRETVSRRMSDIAFLSPDTFDFAFLAFEQGEGYQTGGYTLVEHEEKEKLRRKKEQIQKDLFLFNSQLYMICSLQQVVLQSLGTIYSYQKQLEQNVLTAGFDWLLGQLSRNQHRQIREVSRNAVVQVSESADTVEELRKKVGHSLYKIQAELRDAHTGSRSAEKMLYRAKVDMMFALVHLLPHCDSLQHVQGTVKILISYWDDPDSYVRAAAIQLVEAMGELEIPGIKQLLLSSHSNSSTTARPDAVDLRGEITKRANDPFYEEKDSISRLMQWAFQSSTQEVDSTEGE